MAQLELASQNPNFEMSITDHLESLRWHIMRAVIAVLTCSIVLFFFKEFVFDTVILAPKNVDFWTYRMLCRLGSFLNVNDLCVNKISIDLINTELTGQFSLHMWISFVGGCIIAFPYILWEIWQFVMPALTEKEKKHTRGFVTYASLLFITGAIFAYFIIVPLSIQFLGNYFVSGAVANLIDVNSFISTVTTLTLAMGIVFELPLVIYLLTLLGVVNPIGLRKFRKFAIIIILIVGGIITPSPDMTSQILVSLPLYALYEISILLSAIVAKRKKIENI
jgi:sec-independent protein translocase protein TatC